MRLLRHLAPQRRLVVAAVICSLLNKLFDLAPPILIGLAVDVVLLKEQSVLAGFGLRTAAQITKVSRARPHSCWPCSPL